MRNVHLVHLMGFFQSLLFIVPVMMPYLQTKGLTSGDFILLQSTYTFVTMLCIIPAGYLADRWERRRVVQLSLGLYAMASVLIYVFTSFESLLVAFALIGASLGVVNNTTSTILFETLKHHGKEERFKTHAGLDRSLDFFALAVASIFSGFLFAWHEDAPVLLTAVTAVLGFITTLFLTETPREKLAVTHKNPLKNIAHAVHLAATSHPEIKWIVMFSSILMAATLALQYLKQPFFTEIGLPIEWFGILDFFAFGIGAIGGLLTARVEAFFGIRKSFIFLATVVVAAFAGMYVFDSVYASAFMLIGSIVFAMATPIVDDALHKRASSDVRSTVMSISGFPRRLVFVVFAPALAYGVESATVALTAGVAAWIVSLGLAFALYKLVRYRII